MFEEMVISSPNPKKTNKPWTVVVSMLFQVAFLGILILIPLIYTEALPKTMMATMLTAPPPPPPSPPRWWQRPGCAHRQPRSAGLSASRAPDTHFGHRALARHHWQGRRNYVFGSDVRPSAAAAGGA